MSSEPKTIARGKALYAVNCARWHGPEGTGELNPWGVLFYKIWSGSIRYGQGPKQDMPGSD